MPTGYFYAHEYDQFWIFLLLNANFGHWLQLIMQNIAKVKLFRNKYIIVIYIRMKVCAMCADGEKESRNFLDNMKSCDAWNIYGFIFSVGTAPEWKRVEVLDDKIYYYLCFVCDFRKIVVDVWAKVAMTPSFEGFFFNEASLVNWKLLDRRIIFFFNGFLWLEEWDFE